MHRLLTLLMMLVLVVANGPAVAAAICQHHDAGAHAAARRSADAVVAANALIEEVGAKASSLDAAMGDAAGTLLSGYIVPPEPTLSRRASASMAIRAADAHRLSSRSTAPLLEPPLA